MPSTVDVAVRDRLRQDILSGELPPGTRLPIAALTRRYGVGPTPLRVALRELQGQGLVTMVPHCGASVRAVDEEFLGNVYDLRIAVLRMVYEKCVLYINNEHIAQLEAVQDELEAATRAEAVAEIRGLNRAFHATVIAVARNREAAEVLERNWVLIDSLRARYGFAEKQMIAVNKTHRRIIEALKRRDGAAAFELARASAERSRQGFLQMMAQRSAAPAHSS
jgi:DNA-binding GntR family transcriptional regulator